VGSQISGTRSRRHSSASTQASIRSVLRANGASSLDLLGVGDRHLPAGQLELVVDAPGAVHRLDRRLDRLTEGGGLAGQPAQLVGVGRCLGDLDGAALLVEQTRPAACVTDPTLRATLPSACWW
jgi:hypothetical protein